jgi:hypothetical protein
MRNGVVILRNDEATIRHQSQTCMVLSHNGFGCRAQQRHDGLMLVAFQRDAKQADTTIETVEQLLIDGEVWMDGFEIRAKD